MKRALLALCVLSSSIIAGITSTPAQAALLSVSQGGQIINAPSSVGDNGSESLLMTGFNEKQNILLTNNLQVDAGFIGAGEVVNSHLIFLNKPANISGVVSQLNIEWVFDDTILGVMSDPNGVLESLSNNLLGATGTSYPGSFLARGMEGGDSYSGVGSNTLTATMTVTQPGDWIRVITKSQSVPEPSTMLGSLIIAGIGGTFALKRKAKHKVSTNS